MKCRLCGCEFSGRLVFEIKQAPKGAQYYPALSDFSADTGTELKLFSCPICNLYQLDNEPVKYYKDVIRSGGYTTTMKELRHQQYSQMLSRFNLNNRRVFECGCGRGEFLSLWRDFPVKAFGVENNLEMVSEASKKGLNVMHGFIGESISELTFGKCDAFTSFNFLEHQPNPSGMLQGIFNNLTDNGCGLITVPSWEYIEKYGAYYELIVDHLLYFTRDTFFNTLSRNGFIVEDYDDSLEDTHAAFVRKAYNPVSSTISGSETKLSSALTGFALEIQDRPGKLIVWGASHQSFTLLGCSGISKHISFIVDSAKFKQGRFSPGSHILICAPDVLLEEPISGLIIIAPNYTDEILSIARSQMRLNCPIVSIRNGVMSRH
jgi:SAM-dependent methyltransferase